MDARSPTSLTSALATTCPSDHLPPGPVKGFPMPAKVRAMHPDVPDHRHGRTSVSVMPHRSVIFQLPTSGRGLQTYERLESRSLQRAERREPSAIGSTRHLGNASSHAATRAAIPWTAWKHATSLTSRSTNPTTTRAKTSTRTVHVRLNLRQRNQCQLVQRISLRNRPTRRRWPRKMARRGRLRVLRLLRRMYLRPAREALRLPVLRTQTKNDALTHCPKTYVRVRQRQTCQACTPISCAFSNTTSSRPTRTCAGFSSSDTCVR